MNGTLMPARMPTVVNAAATPAATTRGSARASSRRMARPARSSRMIGPKSSRRCRPTKLGIAPSVQSRSTAKNAPVPSVSP